MGFNLNEYAPSFVEGFCMLRLAVAVDEFLTCSTRFDVHPRLLFCFFGFQSSLFVQTVDATLLSQCSAGSDAFLNFTLRVLWYRIHLANMAT